MDKQSDISQAVTNLAVVKTDIEKGSRDLVDHIKEIKKNSENIKSSSLALSEHIKLLKLFEEKIGGDISDNVTKGIETGVRYFTDKIDQKFLEYDARFDKYHQKYKDELYSFDREIDKIKKSIDSTYNYSKGSVKKYVITAVIASTLTSFGGFYMSYRYFGTDILVQARYGERLSTNWHKFTNEQKQMIQQNLGL